MKTTTQITLLSTIIFLVSCGSNNSSENFGPSGELRRSAISPLEATPPVFTCDLNEAKQRYNSANINTPISEPINLDGTGADEVLSLAYPCLRDIEEDDANLTVKGGKGTSTILRETIVGCNYLSASEYRDLIAYIVGLGSYGNGMGYRKDFRYNGNYIAVGDNPYNALLRQKPELVTDEVLDLVFSTSRDFGVEGRLSTYSYCSQLFKAEVHRNDLNSARAARNPRVIRKLITDYKYLDFGFGVVEGPAFAKLYPMPNYSETFDSQQTFDLFVKNIARTPFGSPSLRDIAEATGYSPLPVAKEICQNPAIYTDTYSLLFVLRNDGFISKADCKELP
jgi:hypothetical protein